MVWQTYPFIVKHFIKPERISPGKNTFQKSIIQVG